MSDNSTSPEHGGHSNWLAVVIIALAGFLGLAVLGVAFYLQQSSETTLQFTNADQQMLVRAADFAGYFQSYLVRSDRETIEKLHLPGDVVRLAYTYSHLGEGQDFELATELRVLPTRDAARKEFARQSNESLLWMGDDVHRESRDAFAWGDASECGVFRRGSQTVGYYFVCRRRDMTYQVEFLGQDLGDPDRFVRLLPERLDRLEDYNFDPN